MPRFVKQQNGTFLDSASLDGSILTQDELEQLKLEHETSPANANASVVNLVNDIQQSLSS